jgi:probable phosphoglycerate mutase
MRLILVRHGDAYAGFNGVVAGPRGCRGLTPLGRRQAEALSGYFAATGRVTADALLASVLPRAVETAEIIASGLGMAAFRRECDLCEVHTGDADGLEWSEYALRYGSFDMEAEPERVFAPGGDSWRSFNARVEAILARLADEYSGQTVVAVCHAGVIISSLRVLFAMTHARSAARIHPVNTGLTEWEYQPDLDRWTLHTYNEHAHLLGLESLT